MHTIYNIKTNVFVTSQYHRAPGVDEADYVTGGIKTELLDRSWGTPPG